jgi:hypothetical protein
MTACGTPERRRDPWPWEPTTIRSADSSAATRATARIGSNRAGRVLIWVGDSEAGRRNGQLPLDRLPAAGGDDVKGPLHPEGYLEMNVEKTQSDI